MLLGLDGINIHYSNKEGASPLWVASKEGHVDIVRVLIKAGGNVNQARTTDGCTPLNVRIPNVGDLPLTPSHLEFATILFQT